MARRVSKPHEREAPAVADVTLAPFHCDRCGAALAVVDADAARCGHCAANVSVPTAHRAALQALASERAAVANANAVWRRHARLAIPRPIELATNLAPALIFWAGLVTFAVRGYGLPAPDPRLAYELGASVWLPLELAVVVMVAVYSFGTPRRFVELARTELRAGRDAAGGAPVCRRCGAALTMHASEVVVRCLYCHADSLVELGANANEVLDRSTERAAASSEAAFEAIAKRHSKAVSDARGIGLATGVPVALLCLWSFVPALREYFVVNLVLVLVLMFLGMITGAGIVAARGTRAAVDEPSTLPAAGQAPANTQGGFLVAAMFLAPMFFFAGAGTSLGWWEGPEVPVLGGLVFVLPALFFAAYAVSLARRA